ncbi:MAG: hypothetical protein AAGK37_08370 [Pseudomonadota bacterium]
MRDVGSEYVPTAAFLSHFVLERALARNEPLSVATRQVFDQFGVKGDQVYPPREIRLLSWLYCLLVYPTELWKRDGLLDAVIASGRADKDLLRSNQELMTTVAIRSIRNAVAHSRVVLSGNVVEFTDRKGSAPPHFKHAMTYGEASNFLLVLGRAFHEAQQTKDRVDGVGGGNT